MNVKPRKHFNPINKISISLLSEILKKKHCLLIIQPGQFDLLEVVRYVFSKKKMFGKHLNTHIPVVVHQRQTSYNNFPPRKWSQKYLQRHVSMDNDTASSFGFVCNTDWLLPVSLLLVSRHFMILLPFIAFAGIK